MDIFCRRKPFIQESHRGRQVPAVQVSQDDRQIVLSGNDIERASARRLELDFAVGYGQVEYADLPSDDRVIGRAALCDGVLRGKGNPGEIASLLETPVR